MTFPHTKYEGGVEWNGLIDTVPGDTLAYKQYQGRTSHHLCAKPPTTPIAWVNKTIVLIRLRLIKSWVLYRHSE